MNYKQEVEYLLRGKHHLIPVFSSVYHIPERIKEYDSEFFVVFNTKRQKYEIHSIENPHSTYCLTIPYSQLDVRTLEHLWRNDLRMRGNKIFEDIDKDEEELSQEKKREWQNWVEDVAKETQSEIAKGAWT